ncbi:hypothetical protein GJ496_005753, partial [Pomphorhynchus laevis]
MLLNTEWAEVEEIKLEVNIPEDSFGIGISGGKTSGPVVKMIIKNGIAYKDGRLRVGDHILALNDYYLKGMNSGLAAKLVRSAKTSLTILVARPIHDIRVRTFKDKLVIKTRRLQDPVIKLKELVDEFGQQVITGGFVFFTVTLDKSFEELGITAARLVTELKGRSTGIFVTNIEPNKLVDIDGRIKVGDQIIDVNSVSLENCLIEDAALLLSKNTHVLRLSVKRSLQSDICSSLHAVL